MKKTSVIAGILTMSLTVFGLAGCGSTQETVTGKVTAVDDTSVTLALGELEEGGEPGGGPGGTPPEKPDGDSTARESSDSNGSGDKPSEGTPPEKPDGENGDNSQGKTPPEKPEGDGSDNGSKPPELPSSEKPDGDGDNGGAPPEMPSGEKPEGAPDGAPGGMPGGNFKENGDTMTVDVSGATFEGDNSDIKVGDILTIKLASAWKAETVTIENAMGDMPGGGSGEVNQGTSANTIDSDGDYKGETYTSSGDDENALRVTDGATVGLTDITVDKSGGSSSNVEDGDFYGMNAALLVTDGAQASITGANVESNAQNGNGVFSYGSGTVVNISDSTIATSADNSGGIQTTGGATTNATNLVVKTAGNSAAAIRSDRGGGTVKVDGGTYESTGTNSPAVYSTADISVANSTLSATGSEALVIEGKNSITLDKCEVEGNMSDTKGSSSDINVHNVMIYQSMSGDAEEGTSTFTMNGGTLTSNNGDMFYVTNTHSVMTLKDANLVNKDADGRLLLVAGNNASHGWGTAGKNGGQLELMADGQNLEGAIEVDDISTLKLDLTNGSTLTGTINIIDNAEDGDAVDDNAVVTVGEGCTWNLTGDCKITSLDNKGTINFNGHTITLADGTVLK